MRRLAAVPVALFVAALVACSDATDGAGDGGAGDLTGVTWTLDHASMMTLTADMPDEAEITLAFDPTTASGLAACNSYSGGYTADAGDGTLSFDQLASTQMACDVPLMALESAYLEALGAVTGYQVTGGEQRFLVLTGPDAALTFAVQRPVQDLALEGTDWTLTTLATGTQAVSSTIAGTEVSLTLRDGTAAGSGGCNRYHGPYEAGEAGSLTFGPMGATMMACDEAVSSQEQAYFAALSKTATYTIIGDELTLFDEAGSMLLQFSGPPA